MTNTEKRIKFLNMLSRLLGYAQFKNYNFFIFRFHATPQQQNALYQQGRTKPGKIVTNCDGYKKKSDHQYWLAVDLVEFENGKCNWNFNGAYADLAWYWTQVLGGDWGGNWDVVFLDIYHFGFRE